MHFISCTRCLLIFFSKLNFIAVHFFCLETTKPTALEMIPPTQRKPSCLMTNVVSTCVNKASSHLELLQTLIEEWCESNKASDYCTGHSAPKSEFKFKLLSKISDFIPAPLHHRLLQYTTYCSFIPAPLRHRLLQYDVLQ